MAPGRRRARGQPRRRRRAPRPQARQRAAGHRARGGRRRADAPDAHRLRHRPARGLPGHHPDPRVRRHPRLRGAGVGRGPPADLRRGRLRRRDHAVRAGHRPAAVPGRGPHRRCCRRTSPGAAPPQHRARAAVDGDRALPAQGPGAAAERRSPGHGAAGGRGRGRRARRPGGDARRRSAVGALLAPRRRHAGPGVSAGDGPQWAGRFDPSAATVLGRRRCPSAGRQATQVRPPGAADRPAGRGSRGPAPWPVRAAGTEPAAGLAAEEYGEPQGPRNGQEHRRYPQGDPARAARSRNGLGPARRDDRYPPARAATRAAARRRTPVAPPPYRPRRSAGPGAPQRLAAAAGAAAAAAVPAAPGGGRLSPAPVNPVPRSGERDASGRPSAPREPEPKPQREPGPRAAAGCRSRAGAACGLLLVLPWSRPRALELHPVPSTAGATGRSVVAPRRPAVDVQHLALRRREQGPSRGSIPPAGFAAFDIQRAEASQVPPGEDLQEGASRRGLQPAYVGR